MSAPSSSIDSELLPHGAKAEKSLIDAVRSPHGPSSPVRPLDDKVRQVVSDGYKTKALVLSKRTTGADPRAAAENDDLRSLPELDLYDNGVALNSEDFLNNVRDQETGQLDAQAIQNAEFLDLVNSGNPLTVLSNADVFRIMVAVLTKAFGRLFDVDRLIGKLILVQRKLMQAEFLRHKKLADEGGEGRLFYTFFRGDREEELRS